MAAPPLHPDLMPSLRQLVRGLEILVWALPFSLLVCMQEIMGSEWESWGALPLLLSMALLWYGTSRMKCFQPQEGVWQSAVRMSEVLAIIMVGLVPFLHWQQTIPDQAAAFYSPEQKHVVYSVIIFCAASVMFLLNLNHLLNRLVAMLPDPIQRADIRFFVIVNFVLFLPLMLSMCLSQLSLPLYNWFAQNHPQLAQRIGSVLGLENFLHLVTLWIATLIVATSMAMLWKTKEAILNSVFSLEPPLEEGEEEVVIELEELAEDDGTPAEEPKPKPFDPSLN